MTPKPDFIDILRTLATHGVEFIVVGGIAAVAQGAAISTFDLDLVHSRTPENLGRLINALDVLEARYRGQGAKSLRPARSHLESDGHQLLMTRSGPLDLLGVIGRARGYHDLLPYTIEVEINGVTVRLLSLAEVIKTKEEAGRDKDQAAMAILRRTLEEKNKQTR